MDYKERYEHIYNAHLTNISYQWHFINIWVILMFNYPIYCCLKTSISCTECQIFINLIKKVENLKKMQATE